MSSGAPPTAKAVEISKYFTLSDDGRKLLQPEMMPDQFAEALAKETQYPDAIQMIAHYLPKRQGVFWALSCARQGPPEIGPEEDAAIKATERWIAEPSDDNRKACLKVAEAADTSTPVGSAALAAYYSDGLPRTEDPKTNAKAYFMTAKLVGGSVMLAAVADREQAMPRFESFTNKGLEILRKSRR